MKHDQTNDTTTNFLHGDSRMPAIKKTAGLIAGIISSLLFANMCVAADRQDTDSAAFRFADGDGPGRRWRFDSRR